MPTLEELIGENHTINIAITGSGDEKVAFLEKNSGLARQLLEMGFNGFHIYEVSRGSEWKEKFVRVSQDYESVWKPLGFTPSHIAKIVRGKGWEQKLHWIETRYEASAYTPTSVAQTMQKKDWAKRLGYEIFAVA
ncbi:hypothetical protein HYU40_04280 [Candidatus Woesearchaeota archaeon]|nr:hypothetical protein [Candidatus Woesearchaeota archaeon]